MTVWIYIDPKKQVGDVDHLKVFANTDAAEKWLEENDPEGVAFEHEVFWSKRKKRSHISMSPLCGNDAL
jgi:hypothetical protein